MMGSGGMSPEAVEVKIAAIVSSHASMLFLLKADLAYTA